MITREQAEYAALKAAVAYADYINHTRTALEYDIGLISQTVKKNHKRYKFQFNVLSGYDGDNDFVSIEVDVPETSKNYNEIEDNVYKSLFNLEDQLIINSWRLNFTYTDTKKNKDESSRDI